MRDTALRATHMVMYPGELGGEQMIKVRLQGTKEDMEWLESVVKKVPELTVAHSSEVFSNKGTNRYFRKYLEIEKATEIQNN